MKLVPTNLMKYTGWAYLFYRVHAYIDASQRIPRGNSPKNYIFYYFNVL